MKVENVCWTTINLESNVITSKIQRPFRRFCKKLHFNMINAFALNLVRICNDFPTGFLYHNVTMENYHISLSNLLNSYLFNKFPWLRFANFINPVSFDCILCLLLFLCGNFIYKLFNILLLIVYILLLELFIYCNLVYKFDR